MLNVLRTGSLQCRKAYLRVSGWWDIPRGMEKAWYMKRLRHRRLLIDRLAHPKNYSSMYGTTSGYM